MILLYLWGFIVSLIALFLSNDPKEWRVVLFTAFFWFITLPVSLLMKYGGGPWSKKREAHDLYSTDSRW